MSDDGPRLIRPIPRRPFELNHIAPTPPEDDSSSPSPNPEFDLSRLHNAQTTSSESGSIPRAQSVLNMTASTLFGIYSPTTYGRDSRDEPDTPWGTGAQTPIKRANVDDTTFELMKDRSNLLRRRSSYRSGAKTPPPSTATTALFNLSRIALLFVIGMGYGLMVTRLQNEHRFSSFQVDSMMKPGYDWQYLTLWGLSGVGLGGLLPWFDGVWEDTFGKEEVVLEETNGSPSPEDVSPVKDWAVVVRSIGAFVGIVFAIRKLPWASTLQVSLTLALVNPFLWYLIDRSKPGFLLSAAVGLAGSAVLLGINPDVMPTPSSLTYRNESERAYSEPITLGGLASQETIETGIWMLSVLFCSCVCFGNIGRRLALNKSASARGRWAGTR
ncbi:hypothetical protein COL5a_010746 [Colletotrichum fioriniae]|uniref:Insulin-induced protein n=1 Tax=Colletotrichum fioriniae PJ7 TaxID=1445577 RepID=A0A010RP60_9PEZI|nr:uncharacterized protein COL516b_011091 [Colletotrichum fioriniae]EXF82246.1 insulin-induced protein [Colletotrichum fioriniae PJ7]KAJ0297030.1 hypothetical protein COL516b_011091 [Colletotrichum fioriniae]KAJ0318288.1 hypothetical protein COL5a_010746 [Colletotrichum fioriniae]KAJ3941887.1 hypothetical protein N0V96_008601 [Colletotrichum fioriniae]